MKSTIEINGQVIVVPMITALHTMPGIKSDMFATLTIQIFGHKDIYISFETIAGLERALEEIEKAIFDYYNSLRFIEAKR